MAVTLTYDAVLSRVRISATGLGAADLATIERSTDGVRWTTVRGGSAVAVAAGTFALSFVDDYEFSPDVVNTYRVRAIESGAITIVASGSTAFGVNASVVPGLPAGLVDGDLMLCLASIRNSGAGTVNTPTGWTVVRSFGNLTLLGRRYVTGDVAPTITFAGGVANADTIARITAFRRADLVPVNAADLLNASAQDIAYPAMTVSAANLLIIDAMWKQDDATAMSGRSGAFTGIGSIMSTTTGDDASMYWLYSIQTTAVNMLAGTHTTTGGAAAISRSMTVALPHAAYLNEQTATVTPTLGGVWLKSIARPFLNFLADVVLHPDQVITRPARVGLFDIVGRTFPVAVSDVRGSRRWLMYVRTSTPADTAAMGFLLASGDVLYVHVPAGSTIPGGYVAVGDATQTAHPLRPDRVTWGLPLTEVATPGPDVVGAAVTWQTLINSYASWSAVVAANATWLDVLSLTGSPSEVIVA